MGKNSKTCSICCNTFTDQPPQFDIKTLLDIFSIPMNLVTFPLKSISFCLLCSMKLSKLRYHLKLMEEFKQDILNQIHNTANSIPNFKSNSNISCVISKELKRREGIIYEEVAEIKEEPLDKPEEFQDLDQSILPNTNSPEVPSTERQLRKKPKKVPNEIIETNENKDSDSNDDFHDTNDFADSDYEINNDNNDNLEGNDSIPKILNNTDLTNNKNLTNNKDLTNNKVESDSDETDYSEGDDEPIKKKPKPSKPRIPRSKQKRSADAEGIFPCDKCNKIFKKSRLLKHHQKSVHERRYECMCELCGKNFTTKSFLSTHMKQVHLKSETFICETCGAVFYTKSYLTSHIYIVHRGSVEDKTCNICNKTFCTIDGLRIHEKRKHLSPDDRPLKCEFCPFTEHSPYRLKIHMKIHGEKTIPCTFEGCGKMFKKNYELNMHMRIHLPDRPFNCHLCQSSFKIKSKLDRHKKNVHKIDTKYS